MKEDIEDDKPICILEVNENLRRVELGMELTRPLRRLNKNCNFIKKYEEWCNIREGEPLEKRLTRQKNNSRARELRKLKRIKALSSKNNN